MSNKSKKDSQYPYLNRSLKDLPGEYWADIPGFDEEYEISSLGRVKSLRRWRGSGNDTGYYTKEIIRQQHVRIKKNEFVKQYCYTVGITLRSNGKSISRSTARYVYYAFVQPFDLDNKNILVSYEDGDGRNIRYENLFLTTRSDLVKKSIRTNRSRPKFQEFCVPVRQLTITGKLVATYPSITEAEKITGISISGISNCLTGRIYQFKGFRWESPAKTKSVQAINKDSKRFFNEYLWEKLGKPKTSRKQPIASLNLNQEDMKGERWKPVAGCDGAYFISNFGRVKGMARFKKGGVNIWTKGMVLRLVPDGKQNETTSCLLVSLTKNGKKFQRSVARLVYYHFIRKIDLDDRKISIQYKNGKCHDLSCKNLFISNGS